MIYFTFYINTYYYTYGNKCCKQLTTKSKEQSNSSFWFAKVLLKQQNLNKPTYNKH